MRFRPLGRLARIVAIGGTIGTAIGGVAACAPAAVGTPAPAAPAATTSGAFVGRLGRDTLYVEQFTRTPTHLVADLLQRQPITTVSHYDLALGADGYPVRLDYATRRADGTPLPGRPRSFTVLYGEESVVTQIQFDTIVVRRADARRVFPYLGDVLSFEPALALMRAERRDTATMRFIQLGGAEPLDFPIAFSGADSAHIWYFGTLALARVDRNGALLGYDGEGTPNKVVVTRVASVDVAALATHFAQLDAAGQGFGALSSPRDTVRATIGSAQLWVDYGRPAARGRDVWARGILGDTLWRTGANAATQFHTDRDLTIGGQPVPAGTYTLWTHATPGGYELVINKQTGQWGTEYHPDRDLVRVPLAASALPQPVERFTIALDPAGTGGQLRLMWGGRALSVPVMVR